MEIKQAQKKVDELIQKYGGYWQQQNMMLRLVEEVGELARSINIEYGEKRSKFKGDGREIKEELADVLFTVLAIANKEELDAEQLLREKLGIDDKKCEGVYDKKE